MGKRQIGGRLGRNAGILPPGGEAALAAIGLAAFLIGTLPGLSAPVAMPLTAACVAVALAFAVLYALRLLAAPDRRRYALSVPALVDFLAAVPVPLTLLAGLPGGSARLLGVLWALKLIRLNPAFAMLARVLRNERQTLLSVTTVFLVFALFAATLEFLLERNAQPDVFDSVPAALWWAATTVTTTGYGDKVPITFAGRLLGGGVMVAGIGLFALWAGIVASGFAAELRRREFLEAWDVVVRLPLFRDLGAASLAEIANMLKVETCATGAVIVRRGQPGESMYFIAEGAAEVHTDRGPVRLGPGQFFGEAALITDAPRNATVTAAAPTRLLRLDVVDFRSLAAHQPELLHIIEAEDARRKAGGA
jgi:voltage-gated potassium channel